MRQQAQHPQSETGMYMQTHVHRHTHTHTHIPTTSAVMSELLFECYSVPAVAYGIDAVFSLFHNSQANGGGCTAQVI